MWRTTRMLLMIVPLVPGVTISIPGSPLSLALQRLRGHGDSVTRTVRGYLIVQGRADDKMNLGGIKTTSVETEHLCDKADESVLVGAAISTALPNGGPELLVMFVVLKKRYTCEPDELKIKFLKATKNNLNPLFKAFPAL